MHVFTCVATALLCRAFLQYGTCDSISLCICILVPDGLKHARIPACDIECALIQILHFRASCIVNNSEVHTYIFVNNSHC